MLRKVLLACPKTNAAIFICYAGVSWGVSCSLTNRDAASNIDAIANPKM